MSFVRRLFGSPSSAPPGTTNAVVLHGPLPQKQAFPVEVVGESYYQDALWEAVRTRRAVDERREHTRALLMHEPDNQYDRNAIAVLAETPSGYKKVGHLSRKLAAEYVSDFRAMRESGYVGGACDAVIVGGFPDPGSDGGVASLGIWLHLGEPGAVVPREGDDPRTHEVHERERSLLVEVKSKNIRNPDGVLRTQAGTIRGRHYSEWSDDVTTLKRHKALEECASLLRDLVEAAEREAEAAGTSPPWWYYEQLAIVSRRTKDLDGEVEILQRYLLFAHPGSNPRPEIEERLRKAIAKRA